MSRFMNRKEAVSPVIGVILMVAITVILAAVIAAFVFGMAGNLQKTKIVAATARQNGNQIVVIWQGGQDNGYVDSYNVTLNDAATPAGYGMPPTVGNSTAWGGGTAANNHVMVTALFTDGSMQVVLDTYV